MSERVSVDFGSKVVVTLDEQIKFAEGKSQEYKRNACGRRDDAKSWRGGTNESHEAARKFAEAMGGRKLPRISREERMRLADIEDRIAVKYDTTALMYDAISESLRRLSGDPNGRG